MEYAGTLRIKNGTILTMDDAFRVVEGDVWIEDGKIIAVGSTPDSALRIPHSAFTEIDATGKLVLPGFVQAHLHLCQTLFRNRADDLDLIDWLRTRIWPFEAAHTADTMRASVRLGLAEMLKSGVTCLLDMGSVRHTSVIFEEAVASGIRGFFGKALMNEGEGVPGALLDDAVDAGQESVELAARFEGAAGGRIRYAFAPRFVLSCSDGLLALVAELSRNKGIPIHTHAAESAREAELVRRSRGTTNIRHLHAMGLTGPQCRLAHCVWADEEERGLLAETGTRVLHCPGSNLKLGSGIAPIPELLEQGVAVGLGSDGAPCNNSLDPFLEMRLAALVQGARAAPGRLRAREVLHMATRGGAEALGLGAEVGSIEPGKRADLAILDPRGLHAFGGDDPYARIVYSCRATDVTDVLVDGKALVREGKLLVYDEAEVLSKAEESLRALLSRAQVSP